MACVAVLGACRTLGIGCIWNVNGEFTGIGPKKLRLCFGDAPGTPPIDGLRGDVVNLGLDPKLFFRRDIDVSGSSIGEVRSSSSDEVDMDEANDFTDSDVS